MSAEVFAWVVLLAGALLVACAGAWLAEWWVER
jgi:hypothetical protein